MPKPQLIGPVQESTTRDAGTSRAARTLPHDVLKEASRRLAIMSLVAAMLWMLGTVLFHLASMSLGNPHWKEVGVTDGIALVCMVGSLGLFAFARKSDRDPRFILDLGLVYMVMIALALGVVLHWEPVPAHYPISPQISWIGAVILMSAAILPNSPMKTLVAGLIAASMNPIAMLLAKARGSWDFGPPTNALVMHYPDFLLVGVSVVISHVITQLGQQVAKAREMGSYRLVNLLGKGGMGEVWRATHHMLARDAAIKLIHPSALSGNPLQMQRRFETEAKTTAALRSPHTVELYDFGVTADGVFYYVMELLDGIDLQTLVKKFGPQEPARVASILRQVCRSLGDAHNRGMIHRDIKPSNIFLCRMGNEYDFAKVLDFGLVKVVDSTETQMTGEGTPRGTPAHMAPELALGVTEIDGRTDLYGLGSVAYWLLTGNLVFDEKSSTAMMLAHVQKAPVPPSQRSELEIPASLDRAVMMCLAKETLDRPRSARALARLLDDPDLGRWTQEDAELWWRTNMPEGQVQLESEGNGSLPQPSTLTRGIPDRLS